MLNSYCLDANPVQIHNKRRVKPHLAHRLCGLSVPYVCVRCALGLGKDRSKYPFERV